MLHSFILSGTEAQLLSLAIRSKSTSAHEACFEYSRNPRMSRCSAHFVDAKLEYFCPAKVIDVYQSSMSKQYNVTVESECDLSEFNIDPIFIHSRTHTSLLRFELTKKEQL